MHATRLFNPKTNLSPPVVNMAPKRRARLRIFTHVTNPIGIGKELMAFELPTLRDVLKYGLLREKM